jgi:Rad3-related DNA helicase
MLTELETQNRKAAREEFVTAAWEGAEPSQLLPLASAAGLTGDEADNLLARIRQAKEQFAHVNRLPRLRKDAAGASSRFEKVQAQANAEISRLEGEVQDAADVAEIAKKEVYAAEESSRQMLVMYDQGLLPATEVPNEVLHLIERRDAEEKSHVAHRAMRDAMEDRNRRRNIVRNAEEALANMPILPVLEQQHHQNVLQDRLKEARRQLAEAECVLKKAEAKADAARRDIS